MSSSAPDYPEKVTALVNVTLKKPLTKITCFISELNPHSYNSHLYALSHFYLFTTFCSFQ